MSNPPRRLPPKKEVALSLLEGTSIYVHLDPRREGVAVPKNFQKQPQLVLQVGLQMAVNIPDLHVDDDAITCTLSFNRTPFWCCLPWSAVYALVGDDGRGMVWPEDVPPEVATQMQQKATGAKAPRKRPRLAAVPAEPDDSTDSTDAGDSAARAASGTLRGDAIDGPDEDFEAAPEDADEDSPAPPMRPSLSAVPAASPSLSAVPAASPSLSAVPAASPSLSAVPAASPSAASPTASADGAEKDETSADDKPAEPPAGGKKKRELPPYLRVVK